MTKFEVATIKELVQKELIIGQLKGLTIEQISEEIEKTFESIKQNAT